MSQQTLTGRLGHPQPSSNSRGGWIPEFFLNFLPSVCITGGNCVPTPYCALGARSCTSLNGLRRSRGGERWDKIALLGAGVVVSEKPFLVSNAALIHASTDGMLVASNILPGLIFHNSQLRAAVCRSGSASPSLTLPLLLSLPRCPRKSTKVSFFHHVGKAVFGISCS